MVAPRVSWLLKTSGLSLREIEDAGRPAIHSVEDVPTGFGLIGSTGIGKTVVFARRFLLFAEAVVARKGPEAKFDADDRVLWLNWPETAETLKRWSTMNDPRHTDAWVEKAKGIETLYLDDLGAERSKGDDDFAGGVLREVLDSRYRDGLPVFWTSNLDGAGLAKFYGARLVSRIAQAWPGRKLAGPDLRMGKAGKP